MKLEHFKLIPTDEYYLFILKRDQNIMVGIDRETNKTMALPGVIEALTDDELLEVMRIDAAFLIGVFTHPTIEQYKDKQERNKHGQTFSEFDLWFESVRPHYHFKHGKLDKYVLWNNGATLQDIIANMKRAP